MHEETANDALTVKGFDRLLAADYRLEYLESEETYYVMSPKDLLIARPRDDDDHITWLLENESYAEVLGKLKNYATAKFDALDIGQRFLRKLMAAELVEKAANLTPEILKSDSRAWEEWIQEFTQHGKIHVSFDQKCSHAIRSSLLSFPTPWTHR